MKAKERFKVTVLDRKTGEKYVFNVLEQGIQSNFSYDEYRVTCVKLTLDYPRVKVKKKKCKTTT
jgi:hypothetical protein